MNEHSQYFRDIEKILKDLKRSENLTEKEYWQLKPFDSSPATFYGPPKVHKVPLVYKGDHFTLNRDIDHEIQLRPINSNIGSPTYQLSKYLAKILKYLCLNNDFVVNNSKEFAEFVKHQKLEANETIVSFDVVSLFTSIPVQFALEIIKRKLYESDEWKRHTNSQETEIVKLLKFVLNNSYFKFNGSHYHQVSGCAMGSPVSAVIAEIVMQEIEIIAINTSPVPIRWWRRYVDDSNSCLQKQDIDKFYSHLNSINHNIQFTIEMPSSTKCGQQIPFLDTMLTIDNHRHVKIDVYRKSTHTNKYLSFSSHNPNQSKRAVVKSLLDRAKSIPSTISGQRNEQERVVKDLALNGYSSKFIQQTFQTTETPNKSDNNASGFTCIPYVRGVSEQVKRVLFNAGVRTTYAKFG